MSMHDFAELEPCPFCGQTGITSVIPSEKICFVRCSNCDARGPLVKYIDRFSEEDRSKAAEGWNRMPTTLKTEILKIKGDWEEVVNDCRATVSKGELGRAPSSEFKKSILLAEHSPIRAIVVKFRWKGIKYWVAMHWKTHHWESRVNTQRNDRQSNYDRNKAPQDTPVDFTGEANAQHLIDTMRKRLCGQAALETRRYAEDLKHRLASHEAELSAVLVPNCVYRGGCPEKAACGLWAGLVKESGGEILTDDIQRRYDIYNRLRG